MKYFSLFLSRLLLLCLLQHLLDDLLLLDQEGAHDAVAHAVGAAAAAVGSRHGFLGLGGGGVLTGSKGWDLITQENNYVSNRLACMLGVCERGRRTYTREFHTTVTAFRCCASLLDVEISEFTAGGLDDSHFVRAGVVSIFSQEEKLALVSAVPLTLHVLRRVVAESLVRQGVLWDGVERTGFVFCTKGVG